MPSERLLILCFCSLAVRSAGFIHFRVHRDIYVADVEVHGGNEINSSHARDCLEKGLVIPSIIYERGLTVNKLEALLRSLRAYLLWTMTSNHVRSETGSGLMFTKDFLTEDLSSHLSDRFFGEE